MLECKLREQIVWIHPAVELDTGLQLRDRIAREFRILADVIEMMPHGISVI